MRFAAFGLALGIAATSPTVAPARDAGDPFATTREVTACAGWKHLAGLHVAGSRRSDGLTWSFDRLSDTQTGRWVERARSAHLTESDGFDGRTMWSRDRSGAAHDLDAADAHALAVSQAWLARRAWCAPDLGRALILARQSRIEHGAAFDVVTLRTPEGAVVTIWLDRASGLLDRAITRHNENTEIDRYADWRTVAGVAFPFVTEIDDPEDDDVETWTAHTATAVAAPGPAAFAQPPAPDDVRMLHGATFTRVPYLLDGEKPIVQVWIDGHGPFPFVVDCGGHLILTAQTAQRVGVGAIGRAHSTGAGTAIRTVGFARVATIRLGDAIVVHQVAKVVPYGFGRLERGPRPPKAGWLGLELFERFAVTFDPTTRTMTLRPLKRPRPAPLGASLPITFSEDAPLVPCDVDGHAGPCMVDTGNAGYTIVEDHWARGAGLASRFAGGLRIGDERISHAEIALGGLAPHREIVESYGPVARGSESTTVEAAILSEDLLDRYVMTLDYGTRRMTLQPIPHPSYRAFNRTGFFAAKNPDGMFTIRLVLPHSPAADAGLAVGDRIVAIDGQAAGQFSGADLEALEAGPIASQQAYALAATATQPKRSVALRLRELLR
jgi:hypothetical protein